MLCEGTSAPATPIRLLRFVWNETVKYTIPSKRPHTRVPIYRHTWTRLCCFLQQTYVSCAKMPSAVFILWVNEGHISYFIRLFISLLLRLGTFVREPHANAAHLNNIIQWVWVSTLPLYNYEGAAIYWYKLNKKSLEKIHCLWSFDWLANMQHSDIAIRQTELEKMKNQTTNGSQPVSHRHCGIWLKWGEWQIITSTHSTRLKWIATCIYCQARHT